jgi:nucleoside-diphosphate-sugar epimerase
VKGSTKYVSVDAVVQAIVLGLTKPETAGRIYHLIDGHIHNFDLGQLIIETIDSFGEVQGAKGQEGVPMDNTAAKNLGVEFRGKEGIKDYVKLVHKLQLEYGGERKIEQW